ncbi:hypothetical protein [Pedobacter gandavensis]|uniref:Uncharacterized protein n=1 Tax=Pedobacter gandavensis TaxID=2679963 RepID=A0ABR6F1Z1_9SPHI|nr:hypothetical protein [Pedobacter gandavensis]MBB2151553.1 hypothetical protein [Pedobacter gandavensis]
MNIMIFKTSVQGQRDLISIRPVMDILFGEKNWTFAFEDVDKILRVVSAVPAVAVVRHILMNNGFFCEELPYSLDDFSV